MKKTSLYSILFLAFLFSSTVSASALSSVVYVDARFNEKYADGHTFGVNAFSTIQEGIDAVSEGGVVHVAQGTYNEPLTITKSLSLIGTQQTLTKIAEATPTIDGKNSISTILVRGSSAPVEVSISDFHIKGGTHGILVVENADMLISGNRIDSYKKNGVTFGSKIIEGEGKVSGTIDNNIIEGSGATDTISQNGIQVAEGNTAHITNNTILNHIYGVPGNVWATGVIIHGTQGVAVSDNTFINNQTGVNIVKANNNTLERNVFIGSKSTNAGIMITDFDDPSYAASKNTITKNIIAGGYAGIWASYAPQNLYTYNVISDTSEYGILFWDTNSNTVTDNIIRPMKTSQGSKYGVALSGGDAKNRNIGSSFNEFTDTSVINSDVKLYISTQSKDNTLLKNNF